MAFIEPVNGTNTLRNEITQLTIQVQVHKNRLSQQNTEIEALKSVIKDLQLGVDKANAAHEAVLNKLRQLQAAIPERHQAPSPDTALRFNS